MKPQELYGGETPEEAMRLFDAVLEGTSAEGPKNVVLANAACGIAIMDPNLSIAESVDIARYSLESGKALATFHKFIELNS